MATSNKHCQTQPGRALDAADATMFDESVAVEGREVDSSTSSEEGPLRAAKAKLRPPARRGLASDSDSGTDSGGGRVPSEDEQLRSPARGATPPAQRERPPRPRPDTSNSESDDSGDDVERRELVVGSGGVAGAGGGRRRAPALPVEGAYDPKQFQDLKVPLDMENLFQYIMKYAPQKTEPAARLRAFVPECAPAVGDCDALLKPCTPPAAPAARTAPDALLDHVDNLGLTQLDEPAAEQSDPALLQLRLRAHGRAAPAATLAKKVPHAERNPAAVERWIRDVGALHAAGAPHAVASEGKMPDVDSLMEEWPERVQRALEAAGLPSDALACSLAQYAQLTCALLDVPVRAPARRQRLHALHLLFTLYAAVRGAPQSAERRPP